MVWEWEDDPQSHGFPIEKNSKEPVDSRKNDGTQLVSAQPLDFFWGRGLQWHVGNLQMQFISRKNRELRWTSGPKNIDNTHCLYPGRTQHLTVTVIILTGLHVYRNHQGYNQYFQVPANYLNVTKPWPRKINKQQGPVVPISESPTDRDVSVEQQQNPTHSDSSRRRGRTIHLA